MLKKVLLFGLCMILFTGIIGNIVSAQDEWEDEWVPWAASGICCFAWIIPIIIWIAIGVWLYKDAESRGKSGALWLIIGLIAGIIGLIIWLIVRPPKPEFYEKSRKLEKEQRVCPNCGRSIPLDAVTCPYCGKKFEPAE